MSTFAGYFAAAQALIVALVLAWSGAWKLTSRRARSLATRSALARLLRSPRWAVAAHVAVGCAETTLAILLLLVPPAREWTLRLAALLMLGFLGYLALAWRFVPDAPCACMAGRETRISPRSLMRAGVLLLLTLSSWPVHQFWGAALTAMPEIVPLLAVEMVGLWMLSPEFGWHGPRFGYQVMRAMRLRLDPACSRVRPDMAAIERDLRESAPYRKLQPMLGVRMDAWREGCWDFVVYGATYQQQAATAIFAVPAYFDANEVSAALVADTDNTVLLAVPSRRGTVPPLASATSA
jgi:hypothetical protein